MSLHPYRSGYHRPDYLIAYLAIGLVAFGLTMILSASAYLADSVNDQYRFLIQQSKSFLLGLLALGFASLLPYETWKKWAVPILFGVLGVLVIVFLNPACRGVHRCIDLGPIHFQPAEFVKVGFLIYIAAWLTTLGSRLHDLKDGLGSFLVMLGLVGGLIFLEPDMGTAMTLVLSAVILYFLAGAPVHHLAGLFAVGVLAVLLMAGSADYRLERLQTFFAGAGQDTLGAGYHTNQLANAIGSGGWWGLGLGQGKLKELGYLPEVHTDSIFAVVVEELGFVRALLVLGVYLVLILRGLQVAKLAPDRFGQLLAAGLTGLIAMQASINLGAMLGLVPLTGIPLPLISYGGSSLVATLFSVGILLSISRQTMQASSSKERP